MTDQNQNPIDPETQKRLNTPLEMQSGFDPADEAFLHQIVAHVDEKRIDLYVPSSLINDQVYSGLADAEKAVIDQKAFTTLGAIRDIYNLWKTYQQPTFQLQNLLSQVRLAKEQFETAEGDVFII
jgi:hypothetical protein